MGKTEVYLKEPGKKPRHTYVSASEENMRKMFGIFAGKQYEHENLFLVYGVEAEDYEPFNFEFDNTDYYGTVMFCSLDPDNGITGVKISWEEYKKMFPELFEPETEYGRQFTY